MIELHQAVLLAILQGLTEFLPISSSAHLLMPTLLLGWRDQGLAFDVAVHVGTLSAVVLYYRADLVRMAGRWLRSLAGGAACDESRLVWYIAVATVPAGLAGLLAEDFIEANLRSLPLMASTTLGFGVLLGIADRRARAIGRSRSLGLFEALLIGCAQAFALVPGVSRSGVTMTAALFLGMSRQDCARFSFLLSIPVIAGAGLLEAVQLAGGDRPVDWLLLGTAALVSATTAYLCIAAFLRVLDRIGFMPFVYYRLALAGVLYILWLA